MSCLDLPNAGMIGQCQQRKLGRYIVLIASMQLRGMRQYRWTFLELLNPGEYQLGVLNLAGIPFSCETELLHCTLINGLCILETLCPGRGRGGAYWVQEECRIKLPRPPQVFYKANLCKVLFLGWKPGLVSSVLCVYIALCPCHQTWLANQWPGRPARLTHSQNGEGTSSLPCISLSGAGAVGGFDVPVCSLVVCCQQLWGERAGELGIHTMVS